MRSPRAPGVRPTTDRVRSALFSVLAPWGIEGARVADLFAGTGAVGIEALSRGAGHAVFVEADRRQAEVIRENLRVTRMAERAEVVHSTVETAIERMEPGFDIILMDPPYTKPFPAGVVERISERQLVGSDGLVVVGHATRTPSPERCGALVRTQDRRYGDASLAFYEPVEAAP